VMLYLLLTATFRMFAVYSVQVRYQVPSASSLCFSIYRCTTIGFLESYLPNYPILLSSARFIWTQIIFGGP